MKWSRMVGVALVKLEMVVVLLTCMTDESTDFVGTSSGFASTY